MLLKTKKNAARGATKKAGTPSALPAEFFSLMDELDRDTRKRRLAAVKIMKKTGAK